MRSPNYLVLIRDGRLALAVGAALEERLLRDGHKAMALVPAVRGPDFASSAAARLLAPRRPSQNPAYHGPHVVALDEDGLLASLASLGLPAYVGTQDGDEPRIARWPDAPGAILLPVTTARDLIDAVASHTPWSRHAAVLPPARQQPARPRKAAVTVASVAAGPLLLASLPPLAIGIGGAATYAPALAAATAPSATATVATATVATATGATAATLTADAQPDAVIPPIAVGPAPVPIPPTNLGTPGTWSNLLSQASGYLGQAAAQAFANATTTGAGTSASQSGANAMSSWAQSAVARITQAHDCADPWGNLAQHNATVPVATASTSGGTTTSGSPSSGNTTSGFHPWNWANPNATTPPAHPSWGQWVKMPAMPVSTAASSSGDTTTATSTSSTSTGNTGAGFHPWNGAQDNTATSPAHHSWRQWNKVPAMPTAVSSGFRPGQPMITASTGSAPRAALANSQPSHPAPSTRVQSGNTKTPPRVASRSGGGGGGGGGGGEAAAAFGRNSGETNPVLAPVHVAPLQSTTPPKANAVPRYSGQSPQGPLGPGDFYAPDGSDEPLGPDGQPLGQTQVASADNGASSNDGTTNDTGGTQDGTMVVADSGNGSGTGSNGGSGSATDGGSASASSSLGGDSTAAPAAPAPAAPAPPAAAPAPPPAPAPAPVESAPIAGSSPIGVNTMVASAAPVIDTPPPPPVTIPVPPSASLAGNTSNDLGNGLGNGGVGSTDLGNGLGSTGTGGLQVADGSGGDSGGGGSTG